MISYQEEQAFVAQCLMSMAQESSSLQNNDTITSENNDDIPQPMQEVKEVQKQPPLPQPQPQQNDLGTWDCHRCNNTNAPARSRCTKCQGWKGGTRKNLSNKFTKRKEIDDGVMSAVNVSFSDDENHTTRNHTRQQREEYSFDKSGAPLPDSNEWQCEKKALAQW